MQSRENPIVDNEILEPSKPRRRQKVRVRPQHSAAVANRRLSVGRFRPRKQDNVLKETSKQKTSITNEKKVVGRPRMRRPPSLRTPQPRSPSPSAIMKSIKRMRIRGRARPSTASQPSSQGTTMAGRVETSTDKRSLSSSLSSSSPSFSNSLAAITGTTTEIITISPDAHKIRFTLDSNEVTSELPILETGPNAERLVSNMLIPDDIFRQDNYFHRIMT